MLHRTYIVQIAGVREQGSVVPCDIMVEDLVGSQLLPVASAAFYGAPNVTPAPVAWVNACGDNAYYEIRGRKLRLEHRTAAGAAAGFVPRFNLGWRLSVYPLASAHGDAANLLLPIVSLSASLINTPGDANVITEPAAFPDPTYGPCIRVNANSSAIGVSTAPRLYAVHLGVNERKDEDFCHIGGP